MDKKVLIACPINSRSWILPYYLRNLYNLDYNKKNISIYWIINNSTDNSSNLLQEFKQKYENEYNSIIIEVFNSQNKFSDARTTDIREKYTYNWLSILRNRILKKTIKLQCDYLFSSDCDVLLRKDTLIRLLSHNKNVVSSLIYNGYLVTKNIDEAYKYPNILKEVGNRQYQHIVNYKVKNPDKNEIGTIIPVDFTGASILISKEVCKVAEYSAHKLGEDEPFSYTTKQAGFNLWCDVSLFNLHTMDKNVLSYFISNNLISELII